MKSTRQQRLRQRGSLTLACCLMLPAIMLLMISLLVGSNRSREELDAARAARQSAESALAAFDHGLYRDFGLFALTQEAVNKTASDFMLPDGYEQKLEVRKSLFADDFFMGAIARHMSVRATAGLIDEGINRIRAIKDIVPENMTESLLPLKNINPEEADPDIEEDELNEEWFSEYSKYVDKEYRKDYHDSLLGLSPVYIPDKTGRGTVVALDPYKLSSLERLAQGLDTLMFTLPEGFGDQILLTEYSLAYFGSQVSSIRQNGSTIQYRTPDGRLHSQFPEFRQYEQEMIATGAEGEKAAQNVSYFLLGCRIVINLIATLTSDTARVYYENTAALISAGVATISLGTVVIPPEAISAVLIIADSVSEGIKDRDDLLDGEEVKLWPTAGNNAFKVDYRDHLRLLILIQSREKLLDRISTAVKQNYASEYFTEVSSQVMRPAITGSFPQKAFAITIERSYFTRKDEDYK